MSALDGRRVWTQRAMIETAAGTLASFSSSMGLATDAVLLGQVQIPGCHLQILMTEQKLDGAQVGAASSKWVAQACRTRCGETTLRMRPSWPPAHARHTILSVIGCSRSRCSATGTGRCGAEPSPVGAQGLQQRRTQGQVAVLVALRRPRGGSCAGCRCRRSSGRSRRGACGA